MTLKSGKRKTVTRSLRINEEWDRALQEEANREGTSVNALVNRILRRYSLYIRFADRYDTITMSKASFSSILERVPETHLEKVGVVSGAITPRDAFLTMGRPLNLNSLTWAMDEFLGGPYFLKWFKCDHHTKENKDVFHLRHSLGKKWSIFLGSYLKSMFKSILDLDVDSEILDGTLNIVIKHVHQRAYSSARIQDNQYALEKTENRNQNQQHLVQTVECMKTTNQKFTKDIWSLGNKHQTCVALTYIPNPNVYVFKWQKPSLMRKSLIVIMNATVMATHITAITSERLKTNKDFEKAEAIYPETTPMSSFGSAITLQHFLHLATSNGSYYKQRL